MFMSIFIFVFVDSSSCASTEAARKNAARAARVAICRMGVKSVVKLSYNYCEERIPCTKEEKEKEKE